MMKPKGKLAETWGLGASASALCCVLALTGIVLMFHYRPVPHLAWADVVDLREVSAVGALRRVHYWSAQVLLIVLWLHMLRLFLRARHRSPRQSNWTVGVCLLVVALALAATGHVLPWDHQAVAGWTVPPSTSPSDESYLLWVYAAHCIVLPLLGAALIFDHRRRTRRHQDAE